MSHVMIDSSFCESEQTLHLRNCLRMPYAEVFVLRLYCYAMRVGNETGTLRLSDRDIARITEFDGEPLVLREALVKYKFLTPDRVEPDAWYIRGWSRNEAFFDAKKRRAAYQREYRRKQKARRIADELAAVAAVEARAEEERNCLRKAYEGVPLSPSLSLSHTLERDLPAPEEKLPDTPPAAAAAAIPPAPVAGSVNVTHAAAVLAPITIVTAEAFKGYVADKMALPPIKPAHRPLLMELAPFTPEELAAAWIQVQKVGGVPSAALLLRKVAQGRQDAQRVTSLAPARCKSVPSGASGPPQDLSYKGRMHARGLALLRSEAAK